MEDKDRNEIYSKKVRAGKRTYFFDVRATRAGDNYLTITESKRKFKEDGEGVFYEKHKIFLYKEDFEKFKEAIDNTIERIEKQEFTPDPEEEEKSDASTDDISWD
mgnify:CR=1 FL=1